MSYLNELVSSTSKGIADKNENTKSELTQEMLNASIKERNDAQRGFEDNVKMAWSQNHLGTVGTMAATEGKPYNLSKEEKGTDYVRQTFDAAANVVLGEDVNSFDYTSPSAQAGMVLRGVGDFVEDAMGMIGAIYFGKTAEGKDEMFVPSEHYEALTEGVDARYVPDILDSPNLAAAERKKERAIEDMNIVNLIQQQDGYAATRFGVQLVDADIALTGVTFGTNKAYKLTSVLAKAEKARSKGNVAKAGKLSKKAKKITDRGRLANFRDDVISGSFEGAKAGAVFGVGEAYSKVGSGYDEAVIATSFGLMAGMVLGGGLSGMTNAGGAVVDANRKAVSKFNQKLDDTVTDVIDEEVGKISQDYIDRLDRGDESLDANPEVDESALDGVNTASFNVQNSSVGASQVPGSKLEVDEATPMLDAKGDEIQGESAEIIKEAQEWRDNNTFELDKEEVKDTWFYKVSNNAFVSKVTGTSMAARMHKTTSPVINKIGNVIFASANGYNRAGIPTASALKELFEAKSMSKLNGISRDLHAYAIKRGSKRPTSNTVEESHKAAFMREVRLERNARRHGKETSTDEAVINAADKYDEMFLEAYGQMSNKRNGKLGNEEHSVLGFEGGRNENPHYTPYVWGKELSGKIENAADPIAMRAAIQKGIAASYRAASDEFTEEVSMAIANAVIERAVNKAARSGADSGISALLAKDNIDELREMLKGEGLSDDAIEGFLKRIDADKTEQGKLGIAKSRNELDLDHNITLPNGEEIKILDLMSNNLEVDARRHARLAAGSSALAKFGIRSRADRTALLTAMMKDQARLGITKSHPDYIPRVQMEAMFTAFDGGAQKGVWGDGQLQEQGAAVAQMKRMVNLAWLDKLGLTQLGESGAIIAQHGLASFMERGLAPMFNKLARENQDRLLEELSFLSGDIGFDHEIFTPHIDLDEMSGAIEDKMFRGLQKHSQNLSNIQAFLSGFNHIRAFQQKTAAAGAADNIFRTLNKSLDHWREFGELNMTKKEAARFLDDYNYRHDDVDGLMKLIDNGTVTFRTNGKHTFVDRLNVNKWDPDTADAFGANIISSVNQTTQKAVAGEQDPFMFTKGGAIMTHLKTFPMLALQKQTIRHFKHMDGKALAAAMYGLSTAGLISMVKALQDGKEMSAMDHAGRAIAYSNTTGFLFMATDPIGTMLGIDEMRYNKYADQSSFVPPIFSYGDDLIRLPGALAKGAIGKADYQDKAAIRTAPFTGLVGVSRLVDMATTYNIDDI